MANVQLEAIMFNHDRTAHQHDALNIRWNGSAALVAPEWRRGVNARPADSVAAFAISTVQAQPITIRARFSTSNPSLERAQIRAVIEPPAQPWERPPSPERDIIGNNSVLGTVLPTEIQFGADGQSSFELMSVEHHQFERYGVGVHYLGWWWQYRQTDTQPWITFALSEHTIYSVLDTPTAPWEQTNDPLNTQLPWVEALDVACRWARGATTVERAATRITQAVYDLGPELLTYNCPNLGAPMYVSPDVASVLGNFNCTAFLDLLRGGIGRGNYVNCSDCATIVSTFANLLGCDLYQSRMGALIQGFLTNPIIAIGGTRWEQPCGWWPGFGMHEVAWGGEATADDVIFDACLAVEAPQAYFPPPPSQPPTNLVFGQPGQGLYRDRLATVASQMACEAQPSSRQRRRII